MNEVPLVAIVDDDDSVVVRSFASSSRPGIRPRASHPPASFSTGCPQGRAACLLLDVHMTEMSGFDLQDRLAVPIIFITAHDDAKTQERIAKSGAVGHLRKPYDEQTVLAAIRRAVQGSNGPLSGRHGERDGAAGSKT